MSDLLMQWGMAKKVRQGSQLNLSLSKTAGLISSSFTESNRENSAPLYYLINTSDVNHDFKNYLIYKLLINI